MWADSRNGEADQTWISHCWCWCKKCRCHEIGGGSENTWKISDMKKFSCTGKFRRHTKSEILITFFTFWFHFVESSIAKFDCTEITAIYLSICRQKNMDVFDIYPNAFTNIVLSLNTILFTLTITLDMFSRMWQVTLKLEDLFRYSI